MVHDDADERLRMRSVLTEWRRERLFVLLCISHVTSASYSGSFGALCSVSPVHQSQARQKIKGQQLHRLERNEARHVEEINLYRTVHM